jgi:restriction system protein
MGIPDYQTLMLPLLKHTADGQEHSFHSLVESLTADFKLTDAERRELLPSGGQFVFDNRVGWARTYMKKAGLLSASKRGVVQITERGLEALATHPKRIDNKVLRQYPEFLEFQGARTADSKQEPEVGVPDQLDPQ